MTTPNVPEQPKPMREIGATGLRIFAGRVTEEYDPKLLDQTRRFKIYGEMSDDPTVASGLSAVTLLARQVQWTFEHEDDTDERIEFLAKCQDQMAHTWGDFIAAVIRGLLTYGFEYDEIVYQQNPDGTVGWHKFAQRGAESLQEWVYDESKRKVTGMKQRPAPTYELFTIPLTKALHFRTENIKDNPEGRSILRACYRPWYFKKELEKIEAIGIERDLAGLPVIYAPAEIVNGDTGADQAVRDYLKEVVTNIRRDEQEGVLMPMVIDDKGNKLYELTLLSTGGQRQFDTDKIVQRYKLDIFQTMMADFFEVGHKETGSWSLHSSKTNLFGVSLGCYLDIIAAEFNRKAIPDLLALNGMDLEDPPKLVHGDIEKEDIAQFGALLTSLSSAGMPLFPDMALENKLRGLLGLEPLSTKEWNQREKEREAAEEEELQRQMDMAQAGKPEPAGDKPANEKPEPKEPKE